MSDREIKPGAIKTQDLGRPLTAAQLELSRKYPALRRDAQVDYSLPSLGYPNPLMLLMPVAWLVWYVPKAVVETQVGFWRAVHAEGMAFWGYGGYTCHPSSTVRPFAMASTGPIVLATFAVVDPEK